MAARLKLIACLLLASAVACASPPPTDSRLTTMTPTLAVERTQPPSPTTPAVASTPTQPPPTLAPTPTATVTTIPSATATRNPNLFPEARLEFRCAELTQTPITQLGLSGALVLWEDNRFPGLLDLRSGESLAWPIAENQRIVSLAVAPNRLQYAYELLDEISERTQLVIARAGAEDVTRVAWPEAWREIIAWLGDDALSISARADFLDDDFLDAVVVVDWPSLRQRVFPPDYPDMWDVTPRPDWGPLTLSEVVYDPNLQLAVYPAYPLDRSEPDGAVVLWDIVASQPIQRIVGRVLYGQAPVWSPDAQQLLVNNSLTLNLPPDAYMGLDQELFSVSRTGEVTRLTFLTEFSRQVSITSTFHMTSTF